MESNKLNIDKTTMHDLDIKKMLELYKIRHYHWFIRKELVDIYAFDMYYKMHNLYLPLRILNRDIKVHFSSGTIAIGKSAISYGNNTIAIGNSASVSIGNNVGAVGS